MSTEDTHYQVTYVRQEWSRQWETADETDYREGKFLDCGVWVGVDDFLEGCYPGEYWFDAVKGDQAFLMVVGKPDE